MLALFGLLFPVAAQPAASQVHPSPDRGPLVISTADSLILEWQAPGVELLEGPDGSVLVQAAGYSQTNRPGAPRLPFNSILIAVPQARSRPWISWKFMKREITLTGRTGPRGNPPGRPPRSRWAGHWRSFRPCPLRAALPAGSCRPGAGRRAARGAPGPGDLFPRAAGGLRTCG
jgi:hypothetical protein